MLPNLWQVGAQSPLLIALVLTPLVAPGAVSIPTDSCVYCIKSSMYSRDILWASRIWKHDNGRKFSNGSAADPLLAEDWKLAGSTQDIESFRSLYNLTLVDASPMEAASMPSWPQALFQFLVVAPPIAGFDSTQYKIFGTVITPSIFLQVVLSPFMFVAWCVSFGLTQSDKTTGGWMSVLGWSAWFDLFYHPFGYLALPPLAFQWVASFALIIQRWVSGLGVVAYQIDNLNGCSPADGIGYLEQGARSHSFRIVQSITFAVSTLFMMILYYAEAPGAFNAVMVMPALAELVVTVFVAAQGTPMVVSGNCMLVELKPDNGFLDSDINTRWKVFASFMGF